MNEYYQMYVEELNTIVPCSEEEEEALLQKIKQGEDSAKARLVEGMLSFALEIAKAYERDSVLLEDLVQEANMALMQFVETYEEGEFRDGLKRAIQDTLEQYVQSETEEDQIEEEITARVNVLQEVSRVMAEDLGREATLEELAEKMKMQEDEIKEIMKMTMNALSVDGMR